LAPQGSLRWNFAGAFAQLEEAFGRQEKPPPLPESRPAAPPSDEAPGVEVAGHESQGDEPPGAEPLGPSSPPGPPDAAGPSARAKLTGRLARRYLLPQLRPYVEDWSSALATVIATDIATSIADDVTGRATAPLVAGMEPTVEAFRFLAARIERLEAESERRHRPIDGLWQLVEPPELGPLVASVGAWVAAQPPPGPAFLAESGSGDLLAALSGVGVAVTGADPRAERVAAALADGYVIELGETRASLAGQPVGSFGLVVLSGVVERAPVAELSELVELAVERLVAGGALAVVSTRPDVARSGWAAVAQDLLPGRPLHPETWELLFARSGLADPATLAPAGAPAYAVVGRRP
jgi:hypothetical protein